MLTFVMRASVASRGVSNVKFFSYGASDLYQAASSADHGPQDEHSRYDWLP